MTYSGSCLYVIDPGLGTFIGCHCNLGRITGVAVHGDEIFVLRQEGFRKVLRIAQTPNPYERKSMSPKFYSGILKAFNLFHFTSVCYYIHRTFYM